MKAKADLLAIAIQAAARGTTYIRAQQRPHPSKWDLKGMADFVTDVDRGAENVIGDTLRAAYPDSTVCGEELTPDALAGELVWVVDPLDGTTNYLHGYPAFAVSIGGYVGGHPAVAVVHDVTRDRVFTATAGGGAFCGDSPLHVSAVTTPPHALIGTGWPFKRPELLETYLGHFARILRQTAGIRRAGAASLDLVDVAMGRFDGFWEPYLAPWDVAAGALIVREASGIATDYHGDDDILRLGGLVAGNPAIHAWLLKMLRPT